MGIEKGIKLPFELGLRLTVGIGSLVLRPLSGAAVLNSTARLRQEELAKLDEAIETLSEPGITGVAGAASKESLAELIAVRGAFKAEGPRDPAAEDAIDVFAPPDAQAEQVIICRLAHAEQVIDGPPKT